MFKFGLTLAIESTGKPSIGASLTIELENKVRLLGKTMVHVG